MQDYLSCGLMCKLLLNIYPLAHCRNRRALLGVFPSSAFVVLFSATSAVSGLLLVAVTLQLVLATIKRKSEEKVAAGEPAKVCTSM